jgi:pyrimidine-specific ribonucleoside hydrolase
VIPLIIDTDPGVDDAVALLMALASPEVEVRAVTTVHGNVPLAATTVNAGRLLALAGRPDVPLAAGADRPLGAPRAERTGGAHGEDGLGGRSAALPPPGAEPDPRGAVALMAEVLRTAPAPVTIAAIGPLTNVALLLTGHPEPAARIGRIVVMGGSFGAGNTTATAEFNVHADPEAAHRVLTQPQVPVTLVPLDLTLRCTADVAWLDALAAAGPRCAELAAMLTRYRAEFRARRGIDAAPLHDAVAVLEAVVPATLPTVPLPVRVDREPGADRGATVVDPRSGTPVDVAVDADTGAVPAEILCRFRCSGGANVAPATSATHSPLRRGRSRSRSAPAPPGWSGAACAARAGRGSPPCAGRERAAWRSGAPSGPPRPAAARRTPGR